ncbi:unnamed protein product, partial [Mesorhabditis spiculigera]
MGDNNVNLTLDEIIKGQKARGQKNARQARTQQTPSTPRRKFGVGVRKGANTPIRKIGANRGRIMKRNFNNSPRQAVRAGNQKISPSTQKLVEELALKTVKKVLSSGTNPRNQLTKKILARSAPARALPPGRNRLATLIARHRLATAPRKAVQVVEEVLDDDYEDMPSTSRNVVVKRIVRPTQGGRKQVIIKRIAQKAPIQNRVVIRRAPQQQRSRIQFNNVNARQLVRQAMRENNRPVQKRQQPQQKQQAPGGRAMNVKNNKMFSALFGGGSQNNAERLNANDSFLDRLGAPVQRKGRGFNAKYKNEY